MNKSRRNQSQPEADNNTITTKAAAKYYKRPIVVVQEKRANPDNFTPKYLSDGREPQPTPTYSTQLPANGRAQTAGGHKQQSKKYSVVVVIQHESISTRSQKSP
ncbi:hypothetical protein V490_01587 [Pseudogymnoascus sp. VKM F-3557]|nr:hypothetical protein V490_01587 [Pseudogymnoascus sp. VKM F-3557]